MIKLYSTLTILTAALLTAVPSAYADETGGTGLFLEPGVTYQLTESAVDYGPGLGNSSAVNRGFGVVVRGGVHVYERFFVAADARYALLDYKDNANNFNTNATSWDIAPVVGLQMKDWGMRIFGGYILTGNLDPGSVRGIDLKYNEATGWRAGVGLKLHMVSVNVEWQRLHYGSADFTAPAAATTSGVKYNADGIVASVTMPFEFN